MGFALHILFSTLAAGGAYAIVMSVFKKEVSTAWLKGEALFTTLTTLGVIVVSFKSFTLAPSIIDKIPMVLLLVATIIGLHLTYKATKVQAPVLPLTVVARASISGIVLAGILISHWFLVVYLTTF